MAEQSPRTNELVASANPQDALDRAFARARHYAIAWALGAATAWTVLVSGIVYHEQSESPNGLVMLPVAVAAVLATGLLFQAVAQGLKCVRRKARWAGADIRHRYVWSACDVHGIGEEGDPYVKWVVLRLLPRIPEAGETVLREPNSGHPAEEDLVIEQVLVDAFLEIVDQSKFLERHVVVATTADERKTVVVILPDGRVLDCEGGIGPWLDIPDEEKKRNFLLRYIDKRQAPPPGLASSSYPPSAVDSSTPTIEARTAANYWQSDRGG